jgi:GTP cyclohydrolase IA
MANHDEDLDFGYRMINRYSPKKTKKLSKSYLSVLDVIGENPTRDGLLKTPERVAKAMQFLTHGYELDPEEILRSAMFRENHNQMVIVKDIEVYSLCEHHLLPFFGKVHILPIYPMAALLD